MPHASPLHMPPEAIPADELAALRWIAAHPAHFGLKVLRAFMDHQGLLLAGAVAYYTLLSIVPLFSLLLVALSHLVDEAQLLSMTDALLKMVVADDSPAIGSQVRVFLEHRAAVSAFGIVVMLVSSSLAFSVLEKCMAVIFFHRVQEKNRHFLISVAMPYLFIVLLGFGLLMVTVISTLAQTLSLPALDHNGLFFYAMGVLGLIMMLTAVYVVIPVGRLSFRHALVGGVTAGLLWEIVRHIMVWYFRTLSMVNVIYGSFATAVLALLSLEVAAVIVLLGAQVIAEFERLLRPAATASAPPAPPEISAAS